MNIFRGEVEVHIGGEKRLVKFGINAMAYLSEETGKDLSELNLGIGSIRDLIWSALKAGAKKKRKDFTWLNPDTKKVEDVTVDVVGDWIEEMPQNEFDKITEAINNSMPKGEATEAKKK